MNKRQRNNTILITLIVLLIALIGGFFIMSNSKVKPKDKDKPVVSIVKYNVYDYDKVDFRFVIAELDVQADKDINIDLKDIKVNKLKIDSKDDYIQKLQDAGYQDDFTNIDDAFITTADSKSVTLFLPIIDKNDTKAVLTSDYFDKVTFDLSQNIVVVNEEETPEKEPEVDKPDTEKPVDDEENSPQTGEQIIEESGFRIDLNSPYSDRDFKYFVNDQEFNSSSNEMLHAFPVKLISKDGKEYEITDAKFVFDKTGSEIKAEDSSFKTIYSQSILSTSTKTETEGELIFISYSQSLAPVTYNGKLLVKINNGEWIELEVTI